MSILVREKDPDTPATYEIDLFQAFVPEALRSREFLVDQLVRAQRDTGFYYRCTQAGRTARNYPTWPRAASETVLDGSVEWTTVHPDDATPPEVDTVVWEVPAALTLDSQSHDDHVARATFSGGTDGEDYDVTARITPTAGEPRDVTITIPVRSQ